MKRILFLLTITVIVWASCSKKPYDYYPIEPQIYYKSVQPNLIDFNDTTSVVKVSFGFNDGDGDLGWDQSQSTNGIYFKDSRDTSASDTTFGYPFPYISDEMRPKNGSLAGNVVVTLNRAYFSIIDSLHLALRGDTLHYNIFIKDKAGHKSNVITTDPIYVKF